MALILAAFVQRYTVVPSVSSMISALRNRVVIVQHAQTNPPDSGTCIQKHLNVDSITFLFTYPNNHIKKTSSVSLKILSDYVIIYTRKFVIIQ